MFHFLTFSSFYDLEERNEQCMKPHFQRRKASGIARLSVLRLNGFCFKSVFFFFF